MGAFNEVILTNPDGRERAVQFKFGDVRQHVYRIGEKILPSFDVRSENGDVTVPGLSREEGGDAYSFYAIRIIDGVITSVSPIPEEEFESLEAKFE